MTGLTELFGEEVESNDEPATVPEVAEEPANQEQQAVESEEEPKAVEKEEESTTDSQEQPEKPETVPLKALMEVRKQKQALERQLAELGNKKEPEKAPDVFENQQGYTEYVGKQIDSAVFNERANMSEFYARREFPDLDDKVEKYKELLSSNPGLQTQVMSAPSPYHEIADIVDKHQKYEQMQNIDEFEAKTRAEIEAKVRAEIEEELKGKYEADANLRKSIPKSLVNAPSVGTLSKQPDPGPTPLSKIFGD